MDLKTTLTHKRTQRVSISITSALISAVLEWFLMFMLYINASFSYLVTRFARHNRLQVPCLLCSRLDHVLGNERSGFYWDLICHNHKLTISSLILCNKLHEASSDADDVGSSDASFASGILAMTRGVCCQIHELNETRKCILGNERTRFNLAEVNASLSLNAKCNRHDVSEINKKFSQLDYLNKVADPRPNVGYSKVKINSDTDSANQSSDNGSAKAGLCEVDTLVQESTVKFLTTESQDVTVVENFTFPDSVVKHIPEEHRDITVDYCTKAEISTHSDSGKLVDTDISCPEADIEALDENGRKEVTWQKAESYNDVGSPSELVSMLLTRESGLIHHDESKEPTLDAVNTIELKQNGCSESTEASNREVAFTSTVEKRKEKVSTEHGEISGVEPKIIQMDTGPLETEPSSQKPEFLDLGDAYKLAVGARLRQLSGKILEQQKSMTESTKASEDVKILLSQLSSNAARGFESPLIDISPRVSITSEDLILQRRISLERNKSNLSLDGSAVSEIEGENLVDRLKRQVEYDKKIMSSLYKELEEERNASAIAANQAMAMITRLQEEKASLHMEALQYLRMMEEQAEYDGEALQKANDLLVEREKQLQDIETELEIYRSQLIDISPSDEHEKTLRPSITQYLKKLELKLSMLSKDELEIIPDASAEDVINESSCKNLECSMGSRENGETESSKHDKEELLSMYSSRQYRDSDSELSTLRQELSTMIKRLEATEAR